MLRKKNITLNGKKAEGKEILAQGDEVNVFSLRKLMPLCPVPGQRKILPITVRLTVP
mgnify:FL=1